MLNYTLRLDANMGSDDIFFLFNICFRVSIISDKVLLELGLLKLVSY